MTRVGLPLPHPSGIRGEFSGASVYSDPSAGENLTHVVTGFPESDAAAAFSRERRRASLARVAFRLTTRRKDPSALLRFADVIAALGRVAEGDLGLQEIALDSIIGTVDRRSGDFD